MKIHWLYRITWLYLAVPFVIFCMGWLRLSIAIPLVGFIFYALWKLWKQTPQSEGQLPVTAVFPLLLIAGIWVFFSGVGGYAFQNWDHHWRNAVLHDLIAYDWPVFYSIPEKGPITMLVYYVGYWLPAAYAGKLLGWKFANFILFLWTWLGVFLLAVHLSLKIKSSAIRIILLLILFSGMDAIGVALFSKEYPILWPPIAHLEIWSGNLQYSSFTTQLFWVFNQAVPAWLCCVLILELARSADIEKLSITSKIFAWSLCFFFAPLISIGLLPYLVIEWFQEMDFRSFFKGLRFDALLSSVIIVLVSSLFFASNSAAGQRGFQSVKLVHFLAFFMLEGGLLWLLLAPFKRRDPRWAVTGFLLFLMPFVQLGNGRDFVMRASIAPLFYLMMMTAEVVFQAHLSRFHRIAFTSILLVGALTPLYEINRSIYRTYEYYFILDETQRISAPLAQPVTHLEQPGVPEDEHPDTLTANGIPTLKFMTDELSRNFIANVRQSLYYRFLSPH